MIIAYLISNPQFNIIMKHFIYHFKYNNGCCLAFCFGFGYQANHIVSYESCDITHVAKGWRFDQGAKILVNFTRVGQLMFIKCSEKSPPRAKIL